jgi:arylsulfatase A-like enzyme
LIVHWPEGIAQELNNTILENPGFLPDIVETCLDVAKAPRPSTINSDGQSFAGLLKGEQPTSRSAPLCVEHEGNRIARDGKWKLVSFFNKPWELFDLDNDRSESTNLAASHPEIVARLDADYRRWANRVGVIPWERAQTYSVYRSNKRKKNASR